MVFLILFLFYYLVPSRQYFKFWEGFLSPGSDLAFVSRYSSLYTFMQRLYQAVYFVLRGVDNARPTIRFYFSFVRFVILSVPDPN